MNEINLNNGLGEMDLDWSYPEKYLFPKNVIGSYTSGAEVYSKFNEAPLVISYLEKVNKVLEKSPFKVAYRVRDEFLIYCYNNSLINNKPNNWFDICLDEMTCMKILSRIEGDESKVDQVIQGLRIEINSNYELTQTKLTEMNDRLMISGYTSFWT